MRHAAESDTSGYRAKAEPGTDRYKSAVAEPTMHAIDQMPPEWRRLVHEFGYVDVYRAWKRGYLPSAVRAMSASGVFVLP